MKKNFLSFRLLTMLLCVCVFSQSQAKVREIYNDKGLKALADSINNGSVIMNENDCTILKNSFTCSTNLKLGSATINSENYFNDVKPFRGVFDGRGHTLTIKMNNDNTGNNSMYTALFRFCDKAKIKNLRVKGSITATNKFAAGLVGYATGDSNYPLTLEHVVSEVNINNSMSSNPSSKDITSGGLAANVRCKLVLRYCGFSGSITAPEGATGIGGLVGWANNGCDVAYCYGAFTTSSVFSGSNYFVRWNGSDQHTNYKSCAILNTMNNCLDDVNWQNIPKYTAEEFASGKAAYMMSCCRKAFNYDVNPDWEETYNHYPSPYFYTGYPYYDPAWTQIIGEEPYPGVSILVKNYIYEGSTNGEYFYVNAEGYYDGTLKFTDGKPFYCPVPFKAKRVEYSRKMSNKWGTIWMPFALKTEGNFRLYDIQSHKRLSPYVDTPEVDTLIVKTVSEGEINQPYLFKITEGESISFAYDEVELDSAQGDIGDDALIEGAQLSRDVIDTDDEYLQFIGVNQTVTIQDGATHYYFIAQDKFWSPTYETTVAPFRAYLSSGASGEFAKNIVLCEYDEENEATDITKDILLESKEKGDIYNLNGQRLLSPIKGQINIINGKKYFGK